MVYLKSHKRKKKHYGNLLAGIRKEKQKQKKRGYT